MLSLACSPELLELQRQFTMADIRRWLALAASQEALCVGERIRDEYVYVLPADNSPKDSLLVYREESTQTFQGGIDMVCAHAAGFCDARFPDEASHPIVDQIIKRRYVEKPFLRKVFVVAGPQVQIPPLAVPDFVPALTIVADYGHGLIGPVEANRLSGKDTFLALTVQTNGLNRGFNLLSKWPRADYVVVDEHELRLACQSARGFLHPMMEMEAARLGTKMFAVTRGHLGCLVYDHSGFTDLPPLTNKVIDRIGAGDAFLATTAALASVGAPRQVLALVGNAAGGLQVGVIGNSRPVTRRALEAQLAEALHEGE